MAKVTGPLMSMDASGKFGGSLVFGKWKGRNVARKLVTPSNPMTADQSEARNRMRATGAIQKFFNRTAEVRDPETVTDKVLLIAAAPSGYAWNGFLVDSLIGPAGATYDAARAAYAALQAGEKTAWNTAAGALTPEIVPVVQVGADNVPTTSLTAGEVHFLGQYGLYAAGLTDTAPGATPPTYA